MNKTDLKKLDVVSLENVVGGLSCGVPEIAAIAGFASSAGLMITHWILMGVAYDTYKDNDYEKSDKYLSASQGLKIASGVTFLAGLAGGGVSLYNSYKNRGEEEEI